MIWGHYDAKASPASDGDGLTPETGFFPGGCSLHNCMTPHGPDAASFVQATSSDAPNDPVYLNTRLQLFETATLAQDYLHFCEVFFDKGLAFMFESSFMLQPTQAAVAGEAMPLDKMCVV